LLRRSKTISFEDDETASDTSEAPQRPSLRRNLDAQRNASLRIAPTLDADTEFDEPVAENPVHQRFDQLRSELDHAPITKGSQESLQALREEFRRKHVGNVDDNGGVSLPSLPLGGLRFSRIALIAVALIAGGIAAWLAVGRQPEPVPVPAAVQEPPPVAPTLEVLVAKSSIAPGTRLSADLLEWQKWPEETVRAEYVTSAAMPEAITDFAGKAARIEILAGEPVRPEKLSAAGAGFLSAILSPGKRGVSVEIDAKAASGGFVSPDDHVDVVLTRMVGSEQVSQTILSDVRVIAINARLGSTPTEGDAATEEGVFSSVALATLELDSTQAELIINATSRGSLSLVLRPVSDTLADEDGSTRTVNETIRLNSPFWQPAPPTATGGGLAPVYPVLK
jgi:pilus assembly protein CpaB